MNRATRELVTEALDAAAPDLLRYLERRLNADDAADALGEVMTVAWRRARDVPVPAEEARMWLFGIARNTLANATRGARRHGRLTERLRATIEASRLTAPAADEGVDVRDAIARLPSDQRELVRLVHWEGFTIAAAGEMLGLPASTARTRYQAARAGLREALSDLAPSGK